MGRLAVPQIFAGWPGLVRSTSADWLFVVSTLVVAYSASDAVIEVNVQTTPPDRSSIYNKRIE